MDNDAWKKANDIYHAAIKIVHDMILHFEVTLMLAAQHDTIAVVNNLEDSKPQA